MKVVSIIVIILSIMTIIIPLIDIITIMILDNWDSNGSEREDSMFCQDCTHLAHLLRSNFGFISILTIIILFPSH